MNKLPQDLIIGMKSLTNDSKVVLKKQTESLKSLLIYSVTSDDDSSSEESFAESKKYREVENANSTTDSDLSENEDNFVTPTTQCVNINSSEDEAFDINSSSTYNISEQNIEAVEKNASISTAPKILGEIDLMDLPLLPDISQLKIDYEKEEFIHIGNVQAIIDTIVTIEALPNTPAYDLDTVLFVDHNSSKEALGTIFDVIGPVASPIYCIRFNNSKEIENKGVKFNLWVYSAPKSEFTQYIFLKELMKIKGTDASWLGDNELPSELADISSDEEISLYEQVPQHAKRKIGRFDKHRNFERNINGCDALHTTTKRRIHAKQTDNFLSPNSEHLQIPLFNPSIPPPGF